MGRNRPLDGMYRLEAYMCLLPTSTTDVKMCTYNTCTLQGLLLMHDGLTTAFASWYSVQLL